ncbi:hypothetical protein CVN56_31340 [Rhodococcus sp. AQ5-07]|nr:hypothetical protein CVN56_31340 [Rhodococcus sp. AQ5-07]
MQLPAVALSEPSLTAALFGDNRATGNHHAHSAPSRGAYTPLFDVLAPSTSAAARIRRMT